MHRADFAGPDANGKMAYCKIQLPKGKTPTVLSENDVSYYKYMKRDGFDFFYGVDGAATSWLQKGDKYLHQSRINLDGLQFAKEKRKDRPGRWPSST